VFRKGAVATVVVLAVGAATPATASTSSRPSFRWSESRVTAAQLGGSWHSGCPVGPAELRTVHLTFWGFDHRAHTGALVVRSTVVQAVVSAFHSMYHSRFPIRHVWPIAKYDGNDYRSMRNDNTSAFNCRYAKANGAKHWSMHAYGEAVDLDPVENPYQFDGKTIPRKGRRTPTAAMCARAWSCPAPRRCAPSPPSGGVGAATGRVRPTTSTSPPTAAELARWLRR
jgi:hypothetical protein